MNIRSQSSDVTLSLLSKRFTDQHLRQIGVLWDGRPDCRASDEPSAGQRIMFTVRGTAATEFSSAIADTEAEI